MIKIQKHKILSLTNRSFGQSYKDIIKINKLRGCLTQHSPLRLKALRGLILGPTLSALCNF